MTKTSVAVMPSAENISSPDQSQRPGGGPMCKNCHTLTTPLWRRNEHGAVLCNACGLFLKLHGRPRPISLKTDVIKSRNRKSTHSTSNSSANPTSAMLHPSPSEARKKDYKKRKTHDAREISAAETLETILQFENGPRPANKLQQENQTTGIVSSNEPGVGNMHVWRKIVPANQTSPPPATPPSHHNVPLPHLSLLLESVKSEERSQEQSNKIQEVASSSLDPEILGDQAQQQQQQQHSAGSPGVPGSLNLSLPMRQSLSHQQTTLKRPVPPGTSDLYHGHESQAQLPYMHLPLGVRRTTSTGTSREHDQIPQMHMASINEILNNQKPKSESPTLYAGSKHAQSGNSQRQSPESKPIPPVSNVRNSSETESAARLRTESQFSDSPPPIDLQTSLPVNSTMSGQFTVSQQASSKDQRSSSDSEQRRNLESDTNLEQQLSEKQPNGTHADTRTIMPHGSRNNLDEVPLPPSASLISLLQGQEEVIKLKTRISELELVTDLYKRHILELDSKCRSLEDRLEQRER
ncbi:LANO_0B07492g1_1 [Lachancea nothofagi CBS 11611]|uniref:LANO_0B07492g1_1 n=1 Tax=Lachancea nothofagi CBS 11611 TaxID=1266666 RepID=A0A1G4IZQ6_9SACH|nr:LANO_0B07492g1_1 [Lachancea nothofagi CBS 11611]